MARNPWHDLHFTEARARAIIKAAFEVCGSFATCGCGTWKQEGQEEKALALGLKRALVITYPPSVRGSMGGFAKQHVLDATAAEAKARRLADRRRKARSRATAKERLAILRLHAAEQSIGTTRITR